MLDNDDGYVYRHVEDDNDATEMGLVTMMNNMLATMKIEMMNGRRRSVIFDRLDMSGTSENYIAQCIA